MQDYTPSNVWLVPKIKFYAIEVARNREGANNTFVHRSRQLMNDQPKILNYPTRRFSVIGLEKPIPPDLPLIGPRTSTSKVTALTQMVDGVIMEAKAATEDIVNRQMGQILKDMSDNTDDEAVHMVRQEMNAQVYSAEVQKRTNIMGVQMQWETAEVPFRTEEAHRVFSFSGRSDAVGERQA